MDVVQLKRCGRCQQRSVKDQFSTCLECEHSWCMECDRSLQASECPYCAPPLFRPARFHAVSQRALDAYGRVPFVIVAAERDNENSRNKDK